MRWVFFFWETFLGYKHNDISNLKHPSFILRHPTWTYRRSVITNCHFEYFKMTSLQNLSSIFHYRPKYFPNTFIFSFSQVLWLRKFCSHVFMRFFHVRKNVKKVDTEKSRPVVSWKSSILRNYLDVRCAIYYLFCSEASDKLEEQCL